jgi:7-carboxy-7-deazaguanine synthase
MIGKRDATPMLSVTEIFTGIQGETSLAGWPCTFIRLAGCNLRCSWCDTAYAWEGGEPWELDRLLARVAGGPRLVAVTGGEPLCQAETPALVQGLLAAGRTVLVETNGSLPIDAIDPRAHRIVDLKPPSSGEAARIDWDNLDRLGPNDELKVVIFERADYAWFRDVAARDPRIGRAVVNLSPAAGGTPGATLAAWILADGLDVRLNVQLHRVLWPGETRGR